jgi:predicted exporter
VPPATGALADYVDAHLAQNANGWRATVFFTGLGEPAALRAWLAERHSGAVLIDLKEASESLMHSYRDRLLELLMLALAGIAALLIWHTRKTGRFLWIVCTVAAALLVTVAIVNIWHGSVTLFHLVSLVLVAGLGVDYCLFFSRSDISRGELGDTRHAVLASAASTAGAFAILGASSIPLLSFIGATVAIGTAVTFVLARFGSLNRP